MNSPTSPEKSDLEPWYVAGLVVMIRQSQQAAITQLIQQLPNAHIHAQSDLGKWVVTLEGESHRIIADQLYQIQATNGVLSAALVYQHHE